MGRKYGKGKYARAICDRSGFEYPYSEMVVEPGTGLFVHKSESDGMYNAVHHPQNYSPRDLADGASLRNARPDPGTDRLTFLGDHLGFWLTDAKGTPIIVAKGKI